MTSQTIHESFISAEPMFQESRFLLLYFIPGLRPEQLNRLIDRLPQRQRDMAMEPGGLARMFLPSSVYNALAPPGSSSTGNTANSNGPTVEEIPNLPSDADADADVSADGNGDIPNSTIITTHHPPRITSRPSSAGSSSRSSRSSRMMDDLLIETNPSELTPIVEEGDELDTVGNTVGDDEGVTEQVTVRDAIQGIVQSFLPVSEEIVVTHDENDGDAPFVANESNDLSWEDSFDQEDGDADVDADGNDQPLAIIPSEDSRMAEIRMAVSESSDGVNEEEDEKLDSVDSEDEDSDIGIEISPDDFTGNMNEGRLRRLGRFLGLIGRSDNGDTSVQEQVATPNITPPINDSSNVEESTPLPPATVTARTNIPQPPPAQRQQSQETARTAEEIEEDRIMQDQIIEDAFSQMYSHYTSMVSEQATAAAQYVVEAIVPSVIRAGLAMTGVSGVSLAGIHSSSRLASSSWGPSANVGRGLATHRESRVGRYVTTGLLSTMAFGLVSVGSSMLLRRYVRGMTQRAISSERVLPTIGEAPDADEVSDDESDDDDGN